MTAATLEQLDIFSDDCFMRVEVQRLNCGDVLLMSSASAKDVNEVFANFVRSGASDGDGKLENG